MKAAVAIVERALALGINVIDTAPVCGTEQIVALALKGKRDDIVLSSKSLLPKDLSRLPPSSIGNAVYRYGSKLLGRLINANELRRNVENSLRRLGTDYLDIFHLHAVTTDQYPHIVAELLPTLGRLREEGKVRFLGLTETLTDKNHQMLVTATDDDCWDVMMVGFNFAQTSARDRVLPSARKRHVGIMIMGAANAAAAGQDSPALHPQPDPFLCPDARIENASSGANREGSSFPTAYRYCRNESGVHVVLMGTGSREHLTTNVRAINERPLDPDTHARLEPGAR